MAKKNSAETPAKELRKRAGDQSLREAQQTPESIATMPPEEIRRLCHELQIHQIELEMQNEELCRTQGELEKSRKKHFDLYDLAPVGYFTLDARG